MTEPCARFAETFDQLVMFVGFVSGLALRADEVRRIAAEALRKPGDEEEEEEEAGPPLGEDRGHDGEATKTLRFFRHLLLEMTMSRAVDNYLTYISELLAVIFTSRPETLRSRETVRVDAVLEHASMEELVAWLAERRVERLAYQGMSTLAEDLSERLGLSLFGAPGDAGRAIRIVEIRNLIVHNRSVVNPVFLSRVPDSPAKEGDRIEVEVDSLFEDLNFLAGLCFDLDQRAAEKFGLPRPVTQEALIAGLGPPSSD